MPLGPDQVVRRGGRIADTDQPHETIGREVASAALVMAVGSGHRPHQSTGIPDLGRGTRASQPCL